jgi:hypothetical protein
MADLNRYEARIRCVDNQIEELIVVYNSRYEVDTKEHSYIFDRMIARIPEIVKESYRACVPFYIKPVR